MMIGMNLKMGMEEARIIENRIRELWKLEREVSSPPSTSPSPSTTEISKKDWELMAEMNNSVYGNPSSLTIHNEKNIKAGNKFQRNLNEIGKSEQKSSDPDRKRKYDWTPDSDSAVNMTTTGLLLMITLIAMSIIR
ncbi:uncharacterized protein LOC122716524 [Apis laboriosa]|uniref:uncharacterized protein LOC122716524 n=1 Tax=Apis laboriosa TaxID=183418 RepID=UPI001CC417C5|nr:uncharacterized protein LOC122716524 [Apis laboriosa]